MSKEWGTEDFGNILLWTGKVMCTLKIVTVHKTMWETSLKLGGVIGVHTVTYDPSYSRLAK